MGNTRTVLVGVLFVVLLGVGGCRASTTIPGTSSQPTTVGLAPAVNCPDLDLRSPSGERINLTGTWTTGAALDNDLVIYDVRQSGECLWGRIYSAFEGQAPGASFDIIIVGTVRRDFTMGVNLLELRTGEPSNYWPAFGSASATFALRSGTDGDAVTLEIVAIQARPFGAVNGDNPGLFPRGGPTVGQYLIRSP